MKKGKLPSFEKKLLKYSLAAAGVLSAASNVDASVVVTNVNQTIHTGNPGQYIKYNIDFNNDATVDMAVVAYYGLGLGPTAIFVSDGPNHQASFEGLSTARYFLPSKLSSGLNIATTANFGKKGEFGHYAGGPYYSGGPLNYVGSWQGVNVEGYLGVKFKIGAETHYGWVKLNVSPSQATIISYAYETTADMGINAPLPVELTDFSANSIDKKVELRWNTATEVNNYGFEIERSQKTEVSSQNSNWEQIGFVKGNGNSNSPKDYSFVDTNPLSGDVEYRLKQVDNDGAFKYSSIVTVNSLPIKFELFQNYPNPFNPSTIINYDIPTQSYVMLKVYDVLGNEVASLVNREQEEGEHKITFNANNLSAGIYLYKLTAGSFVQTRKMILLK